MWFFGSDQPNCQNWEFTDRTLQADCKHPFKNISTARSEIFPKELHSSKSQTVIDIIHNVRFVHTYSMIKSSHILYTHSKLSVQFYSKANAFSPGKCKFKVFHMHMGTVQ